MRDYRNKIHTLDLRFLGHEGAIASYLIKTDSGGILIECGPGSTRENLITALAKHELTPGDITDVLLTHIHLDHAGNAGWLANHGANIHVHQVGAPHMINPEKLLKSAARIYGDQMDFLWGEFLPVPPEKLLILEDGDVIEKDGLTFTAIDTPGHAYHHMSYLFGDVCFSGDVGGVRITTPGPRYLRIPMPPPELNFEAWEKSVHRLTEFDINHIAPTHFGIFDDVDWHLEAVRSGLQQAVEWMNNTLSKDLDIESLRNEFITWAREIAIEEGINPDWLDAFEAANPSGMSADGIYRYWVKSQQSSG